MLTDNQIAQAYRTDLIKMKVNLDITEETLKLVLRFFDNMEKKEEIVQFLRDQLDIEGNSRDASIYWKLLDRLY